ncbi:hypothetical protein [Halorubrum sp. Hd13]|uniref:hypothetical protein n=1 Tax=Halorubrum sp. Hd13 TaxID=1480728 RepID=UPI000B992A4D|nr:hypothetical protein [Halorubrum sp. Hd13]OYR38116.1 hypothetical protein DJ81_18380 [Halorubrum sp. Hd13]
MRDDAIGERVRLETRGETLCVRDALEGEELRLVSDTEPDPEPALTELFPFPVDRAVSFEAESISVPDYSAVTVRRADGEFVARLDDPMELRRGSYCFDVSGVTKALIRATDVAVSTTGMADSGPVDLEFDRSVTVTVGARSLHTRPEATITVPDDPAALAEAVSVLGSSIKEFSAERSWPTLRGYPPRIERGDALDIPSPLVPPDTGVEVVVRPDYADVYRLSTLSYYLGARMVTGNAPAIRLANGYIESLPTEGVALEERAAELLRTWFFLDTLTRTEGYVPSDRYEYELVGSELPFYPPKLADLSMSERLMEYLEVDAETVAPYAPDWPTEAVLRPNPTGAELLPHLAHVLAPVRVRGTAEPADSGAPDALATSPWLAPAGGLPSPDDDPLPAGTSVLTPASYENRLRRETTASGGVRFVALVGSAERATRTRRALSEPAVPDGVGEWEVLDEPDAEAVGTVLSDPDVDVAYCALPVADGAVAAADDTVAVADLGDAPTLTVFEGTDGVDGGLAAVENGGLGSVAVAGPPSSTALRSVVALLAAGTSMTASVSLSGLADETRIRCVGDPGVPVASNSVSAMQVNTVRSESPTSHRFERGSVLSLQDRIGIEQTQLFEGFDELSELVGTTRTNGPAVDSSQLLAMLEQDDSIVRFNDRLLLPSDDLSEADVERMARRALAEDASEGATSGSLAEERRPD